MTLTEFLLARLDDLEAKATAAALATGSQTWWQGRTVECGCCVPLLSNGPHGDLIATAGEHEVAHIVSNDPRHVIADIHAKRQIIEHGPSQCADYEDQAEYGSHHYPDPEWAFCDGCSAAESVDNNWRWTLQILALPYADHPDYDQTWRP